MRESRPVARRPAGSHLTACAVRPRARRRPSRTPAGGGPSLALDLARTRTHAIPHHHIRGLLPAGLYGELAAHAQTTAVEAVHPPRQLRLLRLPDVALRAAPGAQRRCREAGRRRRPLRRPDAAVLTPPARRNGGASRPRGLLRGSRPL